MLTETQDKEEIIARVAALDIGKAELVCCVRVPHEDQPGRRWRMAARDACRARSVRASRSACRSRLAGPGVGLPGVFGQRGPRG